MVILEFLTGLIVTLTLCLITFVPGYLTIALFKNKYPLEMPEELGEFLFASMLCITVGGLVLFLIVGIHEFGQIILS